MNIIPICMKRATLISGAIHYICRKFKVKTRYFIFLSYKGTSYHGWQIQPNSVTVQMVLDKALSTILNENISTMGAGRTDTGVHALFFCAHFDSVSSELASDTDLVFRLNRYLPRDISVNSIRKVVPNANARYSASSRTYKYFISKIKDPFSDDSSWYLSGDLNIQAMNHACEMLILNTDFTSFSKLHTNTKNNICKVHIAEWTITENSLIFTIKADRFLRNMVRAIVGTMVKIGFGKMNISEFEKVIEAKDRCKSGMSAPAKGLFLVDIEYPDQIFI
jgi:tRNA pseudouridine38-40 synthase